jgi:phthiocerol/phenolphthiocerol synthesis type-I polyketide synthase D
LRAARAFVPGRYTGRIVLFRSQESDANAGTDESLGWRRLGADVDVYRVPGDHTTCLTRHINKIAQHLRPYLL